MQLIQEEILSADYLEEVRDLLYQADHEFIPPLSSRNDTTQAALLPGKESDQPPYTYFETMRQQAFILAVEEGHVAGFLSYIPAHPVRLENREAICSYVSTIVVKKTARGKKLTEKMYRALFEHTGDRWVITRTWSLNMAHLTILKRLGFTLAMTLPNDRGEGIDTVYYEKEITHA